jgi:hypothetical protein
LVFGSTSPVGITHINDTDNFAIVDNVADEVFFVNSAGLLQSQCDVSVFSTSPQGITYITEGSHEGNFAIVDNVADEVFIIDSQCFLLDQFDTATFGINSLSPTGIDYIPATDNFEITDNSRDAVLIVNLSRPGRLQGQFGTVIIGSASATGISLISVTDHTAIIDSSAREVFIVNSSGVLQGRFDTAPFSPNPQDIAFDADNEIFAIVDINDDEVTLLDLPGLVVPPPDTPVCEGDFDEDGDVDGSDLAVFAADFGRTDCP